MLQHRDASVLFPGQQTMSVREVSLCAARLRRMSAEGCELVVATQFALVEQSFSEGRSLLVSSAARTAGPVAAFWYDGTLVTLDDNILSGHQQRSVYAAGVNAEHVVAS